MATGGDPRMSGHGPAVLPSPLPEPMTPRTSWIDVRPVEITFSS
jgi:hypothetical protein